ncbi:Zn(II)2Cys6 transcription factor [Aspergillus novofumigatus IBT 16806]|uniref:Putative C6 finger domain protein n=1 Tax=Aspergillus novofumigatus (strain IBT 16806) TaxID=1392255 RepID=A0A2I1BXH8_ASPN1|nr:putative C6 finger domain protein [Aspergillus novofumigatus IBT 16806]PKX90085.1 putative C6 finger domain protein [Aspergillus novofumigatus IBT 16806]
MRRSNGCIPCKVRRKKCDEAKPSCAACIRNHLICAWNDSSTRAHKCTAPATVLRGRTTRDYIPYARLLPQSQHRPYPQATTEFTITPGEDPHSVVQGLGSLHPQLSRDQTGFLYSFFLHKAAQAISIRDKASNPFLHVLAPVAMQSDMVLHSLLAFSGVIYLQSYSQAVAHAVWEQYAQALRSLKHNLTRYAQGRKDLAILLLVTCLLLCASEVSYGDTHDHAFRHLEAAQNLISVAGAHCSSTTLFCFAAEIYSYIMALLPTSSAEPPQHIIGDVRFFFRAIAQHRTPLVGVLCGSAFSLFQLIPDVYEVSTAVHDTIHDGHTVPIDIFLSRQHLHSIVQSWAPETDDIDGARSGLIYQLALLALLDMSPTDDQAIREGSLSYRRQLIAETIQLLRLLPVESNHTTVLCWPLAVLGRYAQDAQHREFIRDYLSRMAAKYNHANMYQTIDLLQLIWNVRT